SCGARVEGVLGTIGIEGNRYFSSERLKNYISVKPGEPIRSDKLNQDLLFINRNPFRQVDVVYKPGKESGTTDIDLVVKDRWPYRFYAGIDSTGNSVTGNNRIFSGFSCGNLFGLDQQFAFEFSTSDDFKSFLGYIAQYTIPLPIKHTMSFYGGFSTVDAKFKIPESGDTKFHNHGYYGQGSFRYNIPINPLNRFLQEVASGLDYKTMNNNLEFGGEPVFSKDVNLFQMMGSYNIGYEARQFVTTFEVELFVSPFAWLPNQSNAVYQTLRPKAKSRYVYGRTSFSFTHFFCPWLQYSLFLRGQAASTNLLPSEEFGVGGYDTVRGYPERTVNGDDVFVANFEISSSPCAFSRLFTIRKGTDKMRILAFFDYGLAGIHKGSPGQKMSQYLYSVGPGMRYQIKSYLTARVDWGFQLHRLTPAGYPAQKVHFQLVASY
ncbi:MAG: ShlB/FhaC/HecB family hemolysin secretion/activation protein, partial [Chlamydiales bacterium]|nr:ShlB/FhaC/HecB family hemolysin secretion/activation protein [Chlamydiales bacterium]